MTFNEIVIDFLGSLPDHDKLKEMHQDIEEQLFDKQMRHEGECEFCDEFWGEEKYHMNMFFKAQVN